MELRDLITSDFIAITTRLSISIVNTYTQWDFNFQPASPGWGVYRLYHRSDENYYNNISEYRKLYSENNIMYLLQWLG